VTTQEYIVRLETARVLMITAINEFQAGRISSDALDAISIASQDEMAMVEMEVRREPAC